MRKSGTYLNIALLSSLAAFALAGCLGNPAAKDGDATAEAIAVGNYCGQNAFRQVVHPQLRANCANCHGGSGPGVGSFAIFDVATAYNQAKARANFNTVGGSLLISKSAVAGHGNNCTACGASWGQTLNALVAEWARAEAGDSATCQNYYFPADSMNPAAGPFELGPYTPPKPENTIVIPEGLTVYTAAGGVHALLRANCAQCHIPGGLAAFAPFAVADGTASYQEAKPRVNFSDIDLSLLLARANTPNHGSGCTVCGNSAFVANLRNQIVAWDAQESVGVQNNVVKLVGKSVQPIDTTDRVITWDLATETVPAQPALAGAKFSIRLRKAANSNSTYRVSDPKIITGNSGIKVQEISFILNGTVNSSVTTYSQVNSTVSAFNGAGVSLAGSTPALLPASNMTTDQIGISFGYLKPSP